MLHLDVMDGHFVPNLTFGPCVIDSLRDKTDQIFDTHLMISDPDRYISEFVGCGSDIITVHAESFDNEENMVSVLERIRSHDVKAGVSLKPDTPFGDVMHHLSKIDHLLIMTVEPGFSGQEFMHEVVPKIAKARHRIDELGLDIDLAVDGGVSPKTAPRVSGAGANVLVAGSAIFSGDPEKNMKELRESAGSHLGRYTEESE